MISWKGIMVLPDANILVVISRSSRLSGTLPTSGHQELDNDVFGKGRGAKGPGKGTVQAPPRAGQKPLPNLARMPKPIPETPHNLARIILKTHLQKTNK